MHGNWQHWHNTRNASLLPHLYTTSNNPHHACRSPLCSQYSPGEMCECDANYTVLYNFGPPWFGYKIWQNGRMLGRWCSILSDLQEDRFTIIWSGKGPTLLIVGHGCTTHSLDRMSKALTPSPHPVAIWVALWCGFQVAHANVVSPFEERLISPDSYKRESNRIQAFIFFAGLYIGCSEEGVSM